MSQNAPFLPMLVLVLLSAPGLVWSEEPHTSNVLHIDSSYQSAGTGGMQNENKLSSFSDSLPVYSTSNHQNAYGSTLETPHDFQSNHRQKPQQKAYYLEQPPTTWLATRIPPPEIDGINPHGINSALRVISSSQLSSSQADMDKLVLPYSPLPVREDPLSKIPIYVIRPQYSGRGSPAIMNYAVIPQEQINPAIMRILQSLRLSQGKVPLILVAGEYPSLTLNRQSDVESGLNTIDYDNSMGKYPDSITGLTEPQALTEEEWKEEEVMKQGTLVHGRKPQIFPNMERFGQVAPQLDAIPGTLPLPYWYPEQDGLNIPPVPNEYFVAPKETNREKNGPAEFSPVWQITPQRMIVPLGNYPPRKDQALPDFLDSQMYQPVPRNRISEYPTQHPLLARHFETNPQLKLAYMLEDNSKDDMFRQQYLTNPSSGVHEPHISSYPSQQNLYSGPYGDWAPKNFPSFSSPDSSNRREPSIHEQPEVIAEVGKLIIPYKTSQYPLMNPENFTDHPPTILKQFYPGHKIIYPFIQKVPRDQSKHPFYPYPQDGEVFNNPERSHPAAKHEYPEYVSRDAEELGNYPDTQSVHPSRSLYFPPHSPPSDSFFNLLPQFPHVDNQPEIQPRPDVFGYVEKVIIPTKQQQVPLGSYPQFPAAGQNVLSDHQGLHPNQYYPNQAPIYPSGKEVTSNLSLPPLSKGTYYGDDQPKLQFEPGIQSQILKARPLPLIAVTPSNRERQPTSYPDGTLPQHIPGQQLQYPVESPLPEYQVLHEKPYYPTMDTEKSTSNVNTLDLASDQNPKSSTDDQLSKYPKEEPSSSTDGEASVSTRPEIISYMEEFSIPGKRLPSSRQQKYPHHPLPSAQQVLTFPERVPDHSNLQKEFPSDDQDTGIPKLAIDEDRQLKKPLVDSDAGIQRTVVTDRNNDLPKYPQFPSASYDGPLDQSTQYPSQQIEGKEPHIEPRTEVYSSIEKFSVPERSYPTLLQKYLKAPSSNSGEPTYSPDTLQGNPYPETNKDTPYYDTAPISTVDVKGEKFSVSDQLNLESHNQKYSRTPSPDTDAPTFYPNDSTRQLNRGAKPAVLSPQVQGYPKQPMNYMEPQIEPKMEVVSNVNRLIIPEQGYQEPLQKYLKASPFDSTNHPNVPQGEPYRKTDLDISHDGQVKNYPVQPMDDLKPRMEHEIEFVPNAEEFFRPELNPTLNRRYPQQPSLGINQPTYSNDYGEPYNRGDRPDFQGYLHEEPHVPNREPLSTPEQPKTMPSKKYPYIPSSLVGGSHYNPDSSHPEFPYRDQGKGHPTQPIDPSKPWLIPRPDVISTIEVINKFNQHFPKLDHRYPLTPSPNSGEAINYPGSSPQHPQAAQYPDLSASRQDSDYPEVPLDGVEPQLRPILDMIYNLQNPSSGVNEPTHESGNRQPYNREDRPGIQDYLQHPIYDQEPLTRPGTDIFPYMEQLTTPKQPKTMPLLEYPSSHFDGPQYNPDSSQLDFPHHEQAKGYPMEPIYSGKPWLIPRPEVISTIEVMNKFNQPFPNLDHRYPLTSSPNSGEPMNYPGSSPQHSQVQYPDFPAHGRDSNYPNVPVDGIDPQLRRTPENPSSGMNGPTFDSDDRQPNNRGDHPDFPDYLKYRVYDKEPLMRPGTDIFPIVELSTPKQPKTQPSLNYPYIPSLHYDGPPYNPDNSHPDFPHHEQAKGHPVLPTDSTKPWLIARPDIIPTVEDMSEHRYPLTPSSDSSESKHYPSSSPQHSHPAEYPDFSGYGQDSDYPKTSVNGIESQLRPLPDIISNMDKLNIPDQPQQPQHNIQQLSSSVTEPTYYPEFVHDDTGLYPDFPAFGQTPTGFPKLQVDHVWPNNRPHPVIFAEIKKANIPKQPAIVYQPRYLKYPLPDNNARIETPERDHGQYAGQKPKYPSDHQIFEDQKYPYVDPSQKPRPETVSEIEKFVIPEQYYLGPPEGYPRHPSSSVDNLVQQPGSGVQQPYGYLPESADSLKEPHGSGELPTRSQPTVVSEIKKLNIPEDSFPFEKYPPYPLSSRGIPEQLPGANEEMKTFDVQERPWFPPDVYTQDQHYPNQPADDLEKIPLHQKPDDLGAIPNSQYMPLRQPIPDVGGKLGTLIISGETLMKTDSYDHQIEPDSQNQVTFPKRTYPYLQPQSPDEETVHIGYPKHNVPQYSLKGLEPQYHVMKQPVFDNQLPKQIPKFPGAVSVPRNEAQQEFPGNSRNPERPDIVSEIGVLKIPESPFMGTRPKYLQYLPPNAENPLPLLGPLQIPQLPPSFHDLGQYPPQQSPSSGKIPPLLRRPDLTAQMGTRNTIEPRQGTNIFPSSTEDDSQQPLSGVTTILYPDQRNVRYPSSNNQLPDSDPSFSASVLSPAMLRTPDREVEPEKEVYTQGHYISPTVDMVANIGRFNIPEDPNFIPPEQQDQQYFPTDGTRLYPEAKTVPALNFRKSNDIDMNFKRMTVPGQIPEQTGELYPQHASTNTLEPESYPLSPDHSPQTKGKPDHHLPVDGGGQPKNSDQRTSPHEALQYLPHPYTPKEQIERNSLQYPFKRIHYLANQPPTPVTDAVERVGAPDHLNFLPMREYPLYPSAGIERPLEFKDYGSEYPLERKVPNDRKLLPIVYPEDGHKKQRPEFPIKMERLEVIEPLVGEQSQDLYATSAISTNQQTQSPNYLSPSNPDYLQPQSYRPSDQKKTDTLQPSEDKSLPQPDIKKPVQASPFAARVQSPSATLEISPLIFPNKDQWIHPDSAEPQIYEINQFSDSPYYPGKSSPPQTKPMSAPPNTWEGPVDSDSPESSRQQTNGYTSVDPDGKEQQYKPIYQPSYPPDLKPGHPSSGSLPVKEPVHMEKITIYEHPEQTSLVVPHLETNFSSSQQPESIPYSPRAHDNQGPIDGHTPEHPQRDSFETSPGELQYDTLKPPVQPNDFPTPPTRSRDPGPTPESTAHSPYTIKPHDLDQQTSTKKVMDETYTTIIYPEPVPSQSDISPARLNLNPELLAEPIVVNSTAPVEQHRQPSTTIMKDTNPLEQNNYIPRESIEGIPEQSLSRLDPVGELPHVSHSPQDIPHTELLKEEAPNSERVQSEGTPGSSVNDLNLPHSTEEISDFSKVKSGSRTTTHETLEGKLYPDETVTTTDQTTNGGSALEEPSMIPSTAVPPVSLYENPLLHKPPSGVTAPSSQPSHTPSDSLQIGAPLLPDSKITRIFPVTKPTFYTDKVGQTYVSLKLLNEPISKSPTGDIIPNEPTDSSQNLGTTDLVIPIGRNGSDIIDTNVAHPYPMLKGIPISNVQVFDAQTIIRIIENCNCSNLKFLIPILKRPQSAIVVANSEYPGTANVLNTDNEGPS